MNTNKSVTEFISNATDEHALILSTLRNLISNTIPEAKEQFKWNRPVYAKGKIFCYLMTAKQHVSFGFYNFHKINDTLNLLEGTGKQLRHIKIKKKEEMDLAVFADMLRQASSG